MARPDLLEVYDGWQILYPSALKGGEGKDWGGPRTTRLHRAARVQGVPWRGNGQQVVHSRSAAPKTEVVAGLIVSSGMLAQGPPGTEQSQSWACRKCSTKATSSCHVCGQAGLGTPMYSVTLRSCPKEHLP